MNAVNDNSLKLSGPSGGGPLNWPRLGLWLPGSMILGAIVAWAAVDAQFYFAPLVIFPLMVGLGLGGLLIALMRIGQIGHRPTIIWGTILAGLLAVFGQHYFNYLTAQNSQGEQSSLVSKMRQAFPEISDDRLPLPPANLLHFLRQQADRGRPLPLGYTARGWMVWMSWLIDGSLTLTGALIVVIPTMLLPFCYRCQTWHRAVRSAHLPGAAMGHISEIVGVERPDNIISGRCRLICCHSGCGPTGCELSWEDTRGDTFFARVWLHTDQRNKVMQVFDRVMRQEEQTAKE